MATSRAAHPASGTVATAGMTTSDFEWFCVLGEELASAFRYVFTSFCQINSLIGTRYDHFRLQFVAFDNIPHVFADLVKEDDLNTSCGQFSAEGRQI